MSVFMSLSGRADTTAALQSSGGGGAGETVPRWFRGGQQGTVKTKHNLELTKQIQSNSQNE